VVIVCTITIGGGIIGNSSGGHPILGGIIGFVININAKGD
jgi:hypothetical protein